MSRSEPPLQRTQTLQEFLDGTQYTRRGILKYETIYGHNFISVGGMKKARELVQALQMKSTDYVLDVGAGVGGSAFLMAKVRDGNWTVIILDQKPDPVRLIDWLVD